ncbi:GNAT family N-acetyltransferase [Sphingobacterium multivorum]|uniref:GNAT family N-acetyltransferase n=1 Tax=Sphingobacterium multivorum TaxID=28454 RepID=UPI0028AE1068|nr:hypothetical protein [Sphingobacterium multivorum]
MTVNIRTEKSSDTTIVFELIRLAFENEQYSDHQEHILVEKLRRTAEFIPQLSMVAEAEGAIAGYILLTKVKIIDKENQKNIRFSCLGSCRCATSVSRTGNWR